MAFPTSAPLICSLCVLRRNNTAHKLVSKTGSPVGPRSSLGTLGDIAERFLRDHLPEKQKGKRRAATARRIILLVLPGLAAAQPLTPVRDDLTCGWAQERGPAQYATVWRP